jgi:hypothetical protein
MLCIEQGEIALRITLQGFTANQGYANAALIVPLSMGAHYLYGPAGLSYTIPPDNVVVSIVRKPALLGVPSVHIRRAYVHVWRGECAMHYD